MQDHRSSKKRTHVDVEVSHDPSNSKKVQKVGSVADMQVHKVINDILMRREKFTFSADDINTTIEQQKHRLGVILGHASPMTKERFRELRQQLFMLYFTLKIRAPTLVPVIEFNIQSTHIDFWRRMRRETQLIAVQLFQGCDALNRYP